jgi:flavin-dependent dehydrogenase
MPEGPGVITSATSLHDVAVIGGGPGGSTVAALLARQGHRVVLLEREPFPRFHVGESLLPANLPLFDRLGVHDAIRARGFIVKHGATFHDQESGIERTFYFAEGKPWPPHAYEVSRAEFDTVLLDHARRQGVDVWQPATVDAVAFDPEGATLTVTAGGDRRRPRARFVVDASGRDSLLATRFGARERIPNLGKVALFAHFRGARRAAGRDEGNIRIFVFDRGWFWWIPFAGDVTSVGCVLHARTVKTRPVPPGELFEEMIAACAGVASGLAGARRITPVHRAANFAYVSRPAVGDRHLAVGDAMTFVDPIFSGGVYIAMRSAELAAGAVGDALAHDRGAAARFAAYEGAVQRGVAPFFRLIHRYYEPAFLDLFLRPRNVLGMVDAVLSVLAGGTFVGMPWRTRLGLELLFGLSRVRVWQRRRAGLPVESRLEW